MPKIQIILDAHLEDGSNDLLLDYRDAFKFIDEKEVELIEYIKTWCDWLNSCVTHKDVEAALLRQWIDGYNFANHVIEEAFNEKYTLTLENHVITIYKPFSL